MTAIAALVDDEGAVWMGADSAATSSWTLSLTVRTDEKVFPSTDGKFLFGYCGSPRMGQLLQYAFEPPDHDPRLDDQKYLVTEFVDALRSCFKDGGFAREHHGEESGGCFLLGYRSRIYAVWSDYQIEAPAAPFHAVGCGGDYVIGSLASTQEKALGLKMPPDKRVELALAVAEQFSAGVRGPFKILGLKKAEGEK